MKINKSSPAFSKKTLSLVIGTLISSGLVVGNSYAETDAGALQQNLQNKVDRERSAPQVEAPQKKRLEPSVAEEGGTAIEVKSFKVTGITLITDEEAQVALKSFANRNLTFAQIKEASSAITTLYQHIGRVAQAVIPPQDVVDGQIEIKVIEGKVGDVVVNFNEDKPSRLAASLINKFIFKHNAPGNFIDMISLERSLALLNELPGNEISGQLIKGSKEESSNIQVNAKDTGWISGSVEGANYGSRNTGTAQGSASLNLKNPLGYGDLFSFDYIGAEGSDYGQLRYRIPLGYDGWRVSAGVSALDYKSLSGFSTNVSKGTAQTYGLYSTYALERSALSNKTIVINYENKNYDNLTNGAPTSKYQINNLMLGINTTHYYGDSYLNWGLTGTVGHLTIDNVNQASNDLTGPNTVGTFGKIGMNVSLTYPLPIDRTRLIASLYGQVATKNLNSAEQFYLGGPYGVRVYPVAQGGGSQGGIATIEINHVFENQLQVGAFIDAGLVQQYVDNFAVLQGQTHANNTYALYSSGLLAKYNLSKVQIAGTLAFRLGDNPLYNQSGQQLNVDNQYNSMQGWLKATYFF